MLSRMSHSEAFKASAQQLPVPLELPSNEEFVSVAMRSSLRAQSQRCRFTAFASVSVGSYLEV